MNACVAEDRFEYKCILKRDATESAVRSAVEYLLDEKNKTAGDEEYEVLDLEGSKFIEQAGPLITDFFETHRAQGATCDFGGITMLTEINRTITDDDFLGWDDDEYRVVIYEGPSVWAIVLIALLSVIVGSIGGFIIAMHQNKKFNKQVRESKLFRRVNSSTNSLVRRSFALPQIENLDELERLVRMQDDDNAPHF